MKDCILDDGSINKFIKRFYRFMKEDYILESPNYSEVFYALTFTWLKIANLDYKK